MSRAKGTSANLIIIFIPIASSIASGCITTCSLKLGMSTQFYLENKEKLFDLLKQNAAIDEMLQIVTDEAYDPEIGAGNYGLATLNEGDIEVAGFTGELKSEWAVGHL